MSMITMALTTPVGFDDNTLTFIPEDKKEKHADPVVILPNTTLAPTTEAPTTLAPTTLAPTTLAPIIQPPVVAEPKF